MENKRCKSWFANIAYVAGGYGVLESLPLQRKVVLAISLVANRGQSMSLKTSHDPSLPMKASWRQLGQIGAKIEMNRHEQYFELQIRA